jgi:hypothetical protein
MANSDMHVARAREQDIVIEFGQFTPANGAAPTAVEGIFSSVTRTGEGLYDFVLKRKYPQFRFGDVVLVGTAGLRGFVSVIDPVAGTGSLRIYTLLDALDDGNGSVAHVRFEFANTTVTRR